MLRGVIYRIVFMTLLAILGGGCARAPVVVGMKDVPVATGSVYREHAVEKKAYARVRRDGATASYARSQEMDAAGSPRSATAVPDDQARTVTESGSAAGVRSDSPAAASGAAATAVAPPASSAASSVSSAGSYTQCRSTCIERTANRWQCTESCTCRMQCEAHGDAASCDSFCSGRS